ncbi:unnamed protein product [Kluyveromyces dobzhanskii CBS 2104]|uniref:WGS project CCBQ000000000 data, contig 00009 n=1 Tax=Kluyveromyces dobzhanskii CBS 2104 TaxID=1427455 RepID=A0A0A8L2Q3_9SACH|nr:unnamed protein product [Kluyveromyces dobzhanskii CBS 2104]
MDSEEVFACSLRESYYGTTDYTFVKPPLLSHTPDFDDCASLEHMCESADAALSLIHSPLLYSVDPSSSFLDDDIFSLDQEQEQDQGRTMAKAMVKPRSGTDAIVIQDPVDAGFSTVPQDNYRIWLEKF